jgi:hypothetical protein
MTPIATRPTGQLSQYFDPHGEKYGFPTFPFGSAPDGLATMRQLRAAGLRPGGQDPVAQILWPSRKSLRVAYLYDTALALPKRTATPAQMTAIAAALTARRTCATCGHIRDYYIPRRYGRCLDCIPGGAS